MTVVHLVAPRRRPWARALLGLMCCLLVVTGPAPSWAATGSDPELAFLELVNEERTQRGLVPLRLSRVISDELSRPWSTTMVQRAELSHSGSGADILAEVGHRYPAVSSAGENVGYAPTVRRLHDALMNSPGHRKNLLDPVFRHIGLGVTTSAQRVWVTQTFYTVTDAAPTIGTQLLPGANRAATAGSAGPFSRP